MSALGQKRTFAVQKAMSALPPIATSNTLFPWRRPPGLLVNRPVGPVPHLAQNAAGLFGLIPLRVDRF